jgi:hypothetical protein
MIALLFAAGLALSSPSPGASASAPTVKVLPFASLTPQEIEKFSPPGRRQLAFAGKLCQKQAVQTAGPDHAPLKKLGELPPGLLEHAIDRVVDGCPVREIVDGGRTYYLDMASPTVERVDPAAHVVMAPAEGR